MTSFNIHKQNKSVTPLPGRKYSLALLLRLHSRQNIGIALHCALFDPKPSVSYPEFPDGNYLTGSHMNIPDATLEIQTLGRFRISVNGETVATGWPDETLKLFFCSLLSPLDLYLTWDRICRSLWDVPETRTDRHRIDGEIIRPLNNYLIKEFGFTPLVTGTDGIRIDRKGIHVDAMEFYSTVLEGLRELSLNNQAAAIKKFKKADLLYTGTYLPGMPGKIITNTRNELGSLYRTVVMAASDIAIR